MKLDRHAAVPAQLHGPSLIGWHEIWGDRRQELVFIGTRDMNEEAIRAELNSCLFHVPTGTRIDTRKWRKLADPFPAWARRQPDKTEFGDSTSESLKRFSDPEPDRSHVECEQQLMLDVKPSA